MDALTRADIAHWLTIIAGSRGGHPDITDVMIEGYHIGLATMPKAAFLSAAKQVIQFPSAYFPSVADLQASAGLGVPTAEAIEAKLVAYLKPSGNDRKMPDDPLLAQVVRLLGGLPQAVEMPAGIRVKRLAAIVPTLANREATGHAFLPNGAPPKAIKGKS